MQSPPPRPRARILSRRLSAVLLLLAAGFVSGFGAHSNARARMVWDFETASKVVSPRPWVDEALDHTLVSPAPVDDDASAVGDEGFASPPSASRSRRPRSESFAIDELPLYEARVPGIDAPGGEPLSQLAVGHVIEGELRRGETLSASLRGQGVSSRAVHDIAAAMRPLFDFRKAQPGHRYRLTHDADGRVLDFRYHRNSRQSLYVLRTTNGLKAQRDEVKLHARVAQLAGVVETSLYHAVRGMGEDPQLAADFATIFAWDIDFSREARAGDEFRVVYERLHRWDDDGFEVYVRPGRILAAEYESALDHHTAVYFDGDDESGAYFRPDGTSMQRQFLIAPLEYSRISSHFSTARRHPILNVTRPHPGIDYAAPRGTRIWSVSDGTVVFKGWSGGFGKLVKVRHHNGYVTYYAHLSRFAESLEVGQAVQQKETLGYVGATGLATGPHVCFRIAKNARYVNPRSVESPPALPVTAASWPAFRHARDLLLAQLDSLAPLDDDLLTELAVPGSASGLAQIRFDESTR